MVFHTLVLLVALLLLPPNLMQEMLFVQKKMQRPLLQNQLAQQDSLISRLVAPKMVLHILAIQTPSLSYSSDK
jgi:hypothetical protein